MTEHTVDDGDCLASIAESNGFLWKTLWDHADNAELKKLRKEPTILKKGDVVSIPEKRVKREEGATEATHRFRLKGVPALLRLRVTKPAESEETEADVEMPDPEAVNVTYEDRTPLKPKPDEPWKNAPFELDVDGKVTKGRTDGDGRLEAKIPPTARKGKLVVEPGTPNERRYELALGGLDPVDTHSGACDRLNNLGYGGGARSEKPSDALQESLLHFQRDNGLKTTGELDQATQDKLRELHGA